MDKLNSAESIRGLAALAVVFSHLGLSFFPYLHHFDESESPRYALEHWIYHSPFAFWYSGTAAVFVFFVLSGFVLTYAVMRQPSKIKTKIKTMLIKRYPRLAIPALLSCLLVWALFLIFDIDSHAANGWLQMYVTQDISFKEAFYEGTIGAFLFADSDTNWVLWTMQIELIGSLLLFLLLYCYSISKLLFLVLSMLLPLLALYLKGEGFFLGMTSFVIGIFFYFYRRSIKLPYAFVVVLIGLYLAGAHNTSHSYQWICNLLGERTYEYCNFFAGVLIVYAVLMSKELSAWLDRAALVWLGKISFSVYLIHLIILYVIGLPILNLLLSYGFDYLVAALMSCLVFIVCTLFFSEFYSRWVDHFAIKISQKMANYF